MEEKVKVNFETVEAWMVTFVEHGSKAQLAEMYKMWQDKKNPFGDKVEVIYE
jgi:hypothetical protein